MVTYSERMARPAKIENAGTRNPERTRERILSAALKEFAAHGFAGARVDAIAHRADINKRMLYHYFGDKEDLFKAVLRRKIAERNAWAEASSGEPAETLPFWFEAACKDTDWVRMLEWEALQGADKKLIDARQRRASVARGLERIRQRQTRGQVSSDFDPRHVMLAMRSLTMFPVAFPQLTELIMGRPVSDAKFQRDRDELFKTICGGFSTGQIQAEKSNFIEPSKAMNKTGCAFIIGLAAAATTALVNGCSRGGHEKIVAGVPVLVAQAFETNVPVQIDPPPVGHVTPVSTVTIHSQIGGLISQVHFQEGSEVKSNQLLFTIDPRPMQAALEAANAALSRDAAQRRNAKIQFDREQKLFEQKLVSQDEFDTSRAALDALTGTVAADQSAVTNAQLNLEFTAIRAPFDGVTGSLQFHEGNVVKAPDDTLLTINQTQTHLCQFCRTGAISARNPKTNARTDAESFGDFSKHDGRAAAGRI